MEPSDSYSSMAAGDPQTPLQPILIPLSHPHAAAAAEAAHTRTRFPPAHTLARAHAHAHSIHTYMPPQENGASPGGSAPGSRRRVPEEGSSDVAGATVAERASARLQYLLQTGKVASEANTIHGPRFHTWIFLEQAFYQLLFPFSLPFIYAFRGHAAVINMRFLPSREQSYITVFQDFLSLALAGAIVLWTQITYSTPEDEEIWWCMTTELGIVVAGAFFQRIMVATKYSFLPTRDYERIMRHIVPLEELQSDQLIVGWSKLNDAIITRELQEASSQLGIDADRLRFKIPVSLAACLKDALRPRDPTTRHRRSSDDVQLTVVHNAVNPLRSPRVLDSRPGGGGSEQKVAPLPAKTAEQANPIFSGTNDGTELLSVAAITKALLTRSDASCTPMYSALNWVAIGLSAIDALLTVFVRLAFHVSVYGSSPIHVATFICLGISRYFFMNIILLYIIVGIVDYRRKCNSLIRLGKLSTRSTVQKRTPTEPGGTSWTQEHVAANATPILPLYSVENAVAWVTVRRLIMLVGQRFYLRVQAYMSQAFLLAIGLTVAILVTLASTLLKGPSKVGSISLAAIALFELCVLTALLLAALRYGARANNTAKEHAAILSARQIELHHAASVLPHAEAASLCVTANALDGIARFIEKAQELSPISILGIRADYAMLNTIAAGGLSIASFGSRQLIQIFSSS